MRFSDVQYPKGPCTQIVYTLGPMHLYGEYFQAKVCTVWLHGPLGVYSGGQKVGTFDRTV